MPPATASDAPARARFILARDRVDTHLTDNEIGKQLDISPRTVQIHLTRIREKTGLHRRSELARWAVQHAIS